MSETNLQFSIKRLYDSKQNWKETFDKTVMLNNFSKVPEARHRMEGQIIGHKC